MATSFETEAVLPKRWKITFSFEITKVKLVELGLPMAVRKLITVSGQGFFFSRIPSPIELLSKIRIEQEPGSSCMNELIRQFSTQKRKAKPIL